MTKAAPERWKWWVSRGGSWLSALHARLTSGSQPSISWGYALQWLPRGPLLTAVSTPAQGWNPWSRRPQNRPLKSPCKVQGEHVGHHRAPHCPCGKENRGSSSFCHQNPNPPPKITISKSLIYIKKDFPKISTGHSWKAKEVIWIK